MFPAEQSKVGAEGAGAIFSRLIFSDRKPLKTEAVLTQIKRWASYSQEYLEKKVNEALGGELEDSLGEAAARLCDALGLEATELAVEGASIRFPGGCYSASYEAQDKKRGVLVHQLQMEPGPALANPYRIQLALEALRMSPEALTIELQHAYSPLEAIRGLKAKRWKIESQLPHAVRARHEAGGYQLLLEPDKVTVVGDMAREAWSDLRPEKRGDFLLGLLRVLSTATP
jgi:hypothetical protein